jgi:hypothetical protein
MNHPCVDPSVKIEAKTQAVAVQSLLKTEAGDAGRQCLSKPKYEAWGAMSLREILESPLREPRKAGSPLNEPALARSVWSSARILKMTSAKCKFIILNTYKK